jgi:hypothetical protein
VLVPESGVGLFVSSTRDNDRRFFQPLLDAFFARYFAGGAAPARATASPELAERAGAAAGRYVPNRHVRSDILKLGLFLGSALVEARDDGAIVVSSSNPFGFDPRHAVPTASGVWYADRDGARIAFLPGSDGDADHLAIDYFTLDRVPWWRDPELHKLLLGACALVFVGTVVGFALGAVARALGRQPPSSVPAGVRAAATAAAALALATLVGVVVGLTAIPPFDLFIEIPAWLRAAGLLPLLAIPLALLVAGRLVRSRGWTPLARLHAALLVLALGVFTALAWSYHLILLG